MTTGIYKLVFTGTNKVYIGQSTRLNERLKEHIYLLKNMKHYNFKLQEAYILYSTPSFMVLCKCTLEELNKLEDKYIEEFNSVDNGLNIARKSVGTSYGKNNPNSKFSEESIIQVFDLLVDSPEKTAKEISNITGVSLNIVSRISQSVNHLWLEERFPEKYKRN